jgi:hypothetical protein
MITFGLVVSIVIVRAADAAPWFPEESVALAVITCTPWLSADEGVKLQAPPPSAVVVPSGLEPS